MNHGGTQQDQQTKHVKKVMPLTSYQKTVMILLALLQFTVVVDFMILSPLGAILIPELDITPKQFGVVVSAYAFSAAFAGICAATFADRFDRKTMLLSFYGGFLLGTVLCALATSYPFLLIGRVVAGFFGGVLGALILAVTSDLFAFEERGRVMGVIQATFGASQVLGIPLGLWLASSFDWHFPFWAIVIGGLFLGVAIILLLKPIDSHLSKKDSNTNPFFNLWETLKNKRYLKAFSTTSLLATGGFMLMPFSSAFSVHNIGISLDILPLVFMATGISALIAGPVIGMACDRFGKFPIFLSGSVVTMIMVAIYTHLGKTPVGILIPINIVLFVGITSRVIPAQAIMSGIPSRLQRGSFMSLNNSVQQISGGLGAILAGMIVKEKIDGSLENFDKVGYVVILATLITLLQMYYLSKAKPDPN